MEVKNNKEDQLVDKVWKVASGEKIDVHILSRFKILQKLGSGAYGIVWKAIDKHTGQVVGLKKIYDAFRNSTDAKRTFREVVFLHELSDHNNIVTLYNVLRAENNNDLYLSFEYMETDLHAVIRAHILDEIHKKFIVYQLLKAMYYVHSANVLHRDLKPGNILLNSDCLIRVADFGLARSISNNEHVSDTHVLTDYIATRWYRAPEILLGSGTYTKSVDMWSIGCILAELLNEKPLFPGNSTLNQLELIIELTGKPTKETLASIQSPYSEKILEQISPSLSLERSFDSIFSNVSKDAVDLLHHLIAFNPDDRYTTEEAIHHPWFAQFYDNDDLDEVGYSIKPDIDDNKEFSISHYRTTLYNHINELREEKLAKLRVEKLLTSKKNKKKKKTSLSSTFPSSQNYERESLSIDKQERHRAYLKKTDPHRWSIYDVSQWLYVINMEQYKQFLIENSISGDILLELTAKNLKTIGIDRMRHRKQLLFKIRALRKASLTAWSSVYENFDESSDTSEGHDSLIVKCKCKDETLSFKVDREDISFRYLLKKVRRVFGPKAKMSFRDKDGDVITLRKQSHLEDILEDLDSGTLFLRVTVSKKRKKSKAGIERGGEGILSSTERDILEGLLVPTCVIDEAGKVLYFNLTAEKLWGYSKSDIHGKNIKIIMPKDVAESHDFYLWKFSRGEAYGAVVGEGRKVIGKHKNGHTIPVHLSVTYSKKKHILTGVFKELRSSVDNSNGRAALSFGGLSVDMLNNLLQCVIVIDKRGIILFFNKSAEKFLGYTYEEISRCNVNILMPPPYEDEHDEYIATYLKTGKAKAIGKGREVTAKCKNGSLIPVKLSISEYGSINLGYFIGILEPIIKVQRSGIEDYDGGLLKELVVPAILMDERAIVKVFNSTAQKLWGYSEDDVIGNNVRMLMGSPDRENHDMYIKRYLRTGESKVIGTGRDVLIRTIDGRLIPARLSVTEKKNEKGERFWTAIVQPS